MVQGSGLTVQGSGCRVEGARFRVQDSVCRVQGSGFRVQSSGCMVQGSGCRVQGAGFRVQVMFRVELDWVNAPPPPAPRVSRAAVDEPVQRVYRGGKTSRAGVVPG